MKKLILLIMLSSPAVASEVDMSRCSGTGEACVCYGEKQVDVIKRNHETRIACLKELRQLKLEHKDLLKYRGEKLPWWQQERSIIGGMILSFALGSALTLGAVHGHY